MKLWRGIAACGLIAVACVASGPATTRVAGLAGTSHQIESAASAGDLLRPRDASSREGERIVLYPHQDWKCMTWRFEPAGDDGAVRLVNYFTHKTFCPEGRGDGARVTQHQAGKAPTEAERWRFVALGDGVYRIEHTGSGKALTATEQGDVVIQEWKDAPGQKWKLLAKPERFTG